MKRLTEAQAVIQRAKEIQQQESRDNAQAVIQLARASTSIRASDAERENAVAKLRHAADKGRLSPDELSDRVGWALQAKTREEVAALLCDLPEVKLVPRPDPTERIRAALGGVAIAGLFPTAVILIHTVAPWLGSLGL